MSKEASNGHLQIRASAKAQRTSNPIRQLVDNMNLKPNPQKDFIPLSIGDPTTFGNLPPPPNVLDHVEAAMRDEKHNGYLPSYGMLAAREAVAKFASIPDLKLTAADVWLASGCSSAIELAITVLAGAGDNILIPRPAFAIYKVVCESHDIGLKYYDLLPHKNWEADLNHMDSLIDANTRAIVVNNPSNPCGSVFSRSHIRAIVDVAAKNRLPIIADEIYAHFVFSGKEFVWFAEESGSVPIISCGGTAKRYLIPGWRLGWAVVYDRSGVMNEIRKGLVSLSQITLGPNSLIQGALPKIFSETPQSFFDNLMSVIQNNATIAFNCLAKIPGLMPVMPDGAMYMMCCVELERFPCFVNDLDFVQKLVQEESVFVLPGKCFNFPNTFRVVLTVPSDKLEMACLRIGAFCKNHSDDVPNSKKAKIADSPDMS